jgi:homoserine kinase type II
MLQARLAGVESVPALFLTGHGTTWLEQTGRLWELTAWMPGRADYRERPGPARLRAACAELARLHLAWAAGEPAAARPCPAVARRLSQAKTWTDRSESGWKPVFRQGTPDPAQPWAERAWRLLPPLLMQVPQLLLPWAERAVPAQPCLCDIWHAHVLFEGDRVTGLVDYGGVKVDHVSVDLARLVGSLVQDNEEGWAVGLESYRQLRPLTEAEAALARALDRTGTVIGAATWLRWLCWEAKPFEDRAAVAARLEELVRRLESW